MMVARAPDDVFRHDCMAVRREWQSIFRPNHFGYPLDSGFLKVLEFNSDKGSCPAKHFGTRFPTHRRLHCKDVMAQKSNQSHEEEARKECVNPNRDSSRLLSREPGWV